jgi:hypothetical protein
VIFSETTMTVGSRASVNIPSHPCFGWVGTVVAEFPAESSAGPWFRLRLDRPLPGEFKPGPRGHPVGHMLLLHPHEMVEVDGFRKLRFEQVPW